MKTRCVCLPVSDFDLGSRDVCPLFSFDQETFNNFPLLSLSIFNAQLFCENSKQSIKIRERSHPSFEIVWCSCIIRRRSGNFFSWYTHRSPSCDDRVLCFLSAVMLLFYAFIHDDLKCFFPFRGESSMAAIAWSDYKFVWGERRRGEKACKSPPISLSFCLCILKDAAQSDHIQERRESHREEDNFPLKTKSVYLGK